MNLAQVTLNPSQTDVPGSNVLQTLANGIAGNLLQLCLVMFLVSLGLYIVGKAISSHAASIAGKYGAFGAILAAIMTTGADDLINWAQQLGQQIR